MLNAYITKLYVTILYIKHIIMANALSEKTGRNKENIHSNFPR